MLSDLKTSTTQVCNLALGYIHENEQRNGE